MPEVVYPKDKKTWGEVFPDLPDECRDWSVINDILYAIALNNRFGGKTPRVLKNKLLASAVESVDKYLAKAKDETERKSIFAEYGMYVSYIEKVFANLGGAYREYKS